MKQQPKSSAAKPGSMKKKSGMIAASGRCLACGLVFSSGSPALEAIRHFESTGHHIRVEQTIYWERYTAGGEVKQEA